MLSDDTWERLLVVLLNGLSLCLSMCVYLCAYLCLFFLSLSLSVFSLCLVRSQTPHQSIHPRHPFIAKLPITLSRHRRQLQPSTQSSRRPFSTLVVLKCVCACVCVLLFVCQRVRVRVVCVRHQHHHVTTIANHHLLPSQAVPILKLQSRSTHRSDGPSAARPRSVCLSVLSSRRLGHRCGVCCRRRLRAGSPIVRTRLHAGRWIGGWWAMVMIMMPYSRHTLTHTH